MHKKIVIGKVIGTHGIKGTLKILPLTDFPERFWKMESLSLYDENENKRFSGRIWNVKRHSSGKFILIDLENVFDELTANQLVGLYIMISPEERVELKEGEYWIDDIIGLKVLDEESRELGTITDVIKAGYHDVYVVKTKDGKQKFIPAVKEFIKKIDIENGFIVVSLMEGLWD